MTTQATTLHPIQILESYAVDTGWNDNSMLAITCDFLQMQGIANPALIGAFHRYVHDRMEEEAPEEDDEPEIGNRAVCERCGQDVEWNGELWWDRGSDENCGPYKGHDGEIVQEQYTKQHVVKSAA